MINVPPIGLLSGTPIPRAGTGAIFSLIYRPETTVQWMALASGIVAPQFMWNMQEASGNLLATVGGQTLTKVSTGQLYQQACANWTTKWVGLNGSTAAGWTSGSNALWTLNTQSIFVHATLAYIGPLVGSLLNVISFRSGNELGLRTLNTSGFLQLNRGATVGNTAIAYLSAAFVPFAFTFIYDRRGAGLIRGNTNASVQWGIAYAALGAASRTAGLGQTGAEQNSASMRFNQMTAWTGTSAETMIDRGGAGLGGATLITNLGWV